jgi:glycosyltransferase involved in cell wall biosynthesis
MAVKEKCNILYIIDHLVGPGGTEKHLRYLTGMLDKSRFNIFIVAFYMEETPFVDSVRDAGAEIKSIPVARYYTPNAVVKSVALYQFIKEKKIDIVQSFHYKADIFGAPIARLAGVKSIISSKRDSADFKSSFNFFMHKLVRPIVKKYIVVSDVVAKVIQEKENAQKEKIVKIYNGVDSLAYRPCSYSERYRFREAMGFSSNDVVIGISAWLREEKDHLLLLSAFCNLLETHNNIKLLVVGGGPLLDHCIRWAEHHGISQSVTFTGAVVNVETYLHAFDVACLVPKSNEGFSNSILEAMAEGLPLVVTDVGGNKEAVEHGVSGYVIAPSDRSDLEESLNALLNDAELRRKMGAEARRRVESVFSLQSMIDAHDALYTECLSDGGM